MPFVNRTLENGPALRLRRELSRTLGRSGGDPRNRAQAGFPSGW